MPVNARILSSNSELPSSSSRPLLPKLGAVGLAKPGRYPRLEPYPASSNRFSTNAIFNCNDKARSYAAPSSISAGVFLCFVSPCLAAFFLSLCAPAAPPPIPAEAFLATGFLCLTLSKLTTCFFILNPLLPSFMAVLS